MDSPRRPCDGCILHYARPLTGRDGAIAIKQRVQRYIPFATLPSPDDGDGNGQDATRRPSLRSATGRRTAAWLQACVLAACLSRGATRNIVATR